MRAGHTSGSAAPILGASETERARSNHALFARVTAIDSFIIPTVVEIRNKGINENIDDFFIFFIFL